MTPGFYVARSHSHTDRQQLWKVLSRPFRIPTEKEMPGWSEKDRKQFAKERAREWMEFVRKEEIEEHPRRKHEYFVVEIV